jgi:hypothetical protein
LDTATNKFIPKLALTDSVTEEQKSSKLKDDQYQVANLGEEDVPMTANLLRLLP